MMLVNQTDRRQPGLLPAVHPWMATVTTTNGANHGYSRGSDPAGQQSSNRAHRQGVGAADGTVAPLRRGCLTPFTSGSAVTP
jgi:hypothetical protein